MKFKSILILCFSCFLWSCGDSSIADDISSIPINSSPIGNQILSYAGQYPQSSTDNQFGQFYTSNNGRLTKWVSQLAGVNEPSGMHDILYNSSNRIDKIIYVQNMTNKITETTFNYENDKPTTIVIKKPDNNGNVIELVVIIQYQAGKVFQIIDYGLLSDYNNNINKSCTIYRLIYNGDNVYKGFEAIVQYSKNGGVISSDLSFLQWFQFQYNSTQLNPYSTFPIEFLLYQFRFYGQQNFDIFSRNVKTTRQIYRIETPVPVPVFDPLYYYYEFDQNWVYPKKENGSPGTLFYKYTSY